MQTIDDILDQRAELERRFRAQVTWRRGTADGPPEWFSQLLTDLVLATGSDDIRYFSAKYVPAKSDAGSSMAVVAFTDDIVAYAVLDGEPTPGSFPLEVVVTARRALSMFSIESEGAGDTAAMSDVHITVTYPHFSRTLPLAETDWADADSETADLIAQLRRDLVA